jgi:hypothetical protein
MTHVFPTIVKISLKQIDRNKKKMGHDGLGWGEQTSAAGAAAVGADPAGRFTPTALPWNQQQMKTSTYDTYKFAIGSQ